MPNTIKIGITENLEQRMKQLDCTSVSLPFEFFAVDVYDAALVEKKCTEALTTIESEITENFLIFLLRKPNPF